ncbi:sigma-54 dependent transcriptional regulator [Pseudomaricurvus sp.]|uniref:sigma-54 dependent transcriptional regulator n=1 Tax=Pseudomaricurvus sp. TaxID=2004510 RepID=UPI003F6D0996
MWRELKVLLVDDDVQRRHNLKVVLDFLGEPTVEAGFKVWLEIAEQHAKADSDTPNADYLAMILGDSCNQVPLDKRLEAIRDWNPLVPVILFGEKQSLPEDADPYLKHMIIGTLDVPPGYNKLLDTIHRAQRYREAQEFSLRNKGGRPSHLFRSLVGTSREIQAVREMMTQVANKDVTVLITGESGTGKEVVARNLHYHSDRRDAPFVPVNCGAIPAELLESELFGHEKGAFTGAINARAGRFEMAEGGTLFLDEIGDMPLNMQVKILRVLQERCFERVGANKSQPVNVRVIAATHRNLEEMIIEGTFREDLYYRLNVFPIEMPSLRERAEDIPLLLSELVSRLESENRGSIRFNSAAIMSICQHEWSGNVRELANLVERMAIMHPYGVIGVQNLPPKYRHVDMLDEEEFQVLAEASGATQPTVVSMSDTTLLPDQGIDLKEYLTSLERNLIQQALDDCGGVVARAAERLSIRRTTLVEKMRKYELQRG